MIRGFLFFGLLLCLAACQGNTNLIPTVNGDEVNQVELDRFIQRQIDSLKIAGISVAIIRENKVVYQNEFGFKNLSTKEECTTKTIFEACSLSKPVFAYFVMLQVEKGILGLDIPLYKYLPNEDIENNPYHKLITARMVLNHSSGLPNWRENTNGELKILFEPGTAFGYSGEGYQYLKDVLNHLLDVDDEGLNELFQTEVVKPLKINFMQFTWKDNFAARKAFGHRNAIPTDNGPVLLNDRDDTFGAGYSLHTTASDYANFLIQLISKTENSTKIAEQLLLPQYNMPHEEDELHRSLAFPIKRVNNDFRYYHSGNNGDYRAYCHFYKNLGYGIVIFSNSDNLFSSGCAQKIIEFLGDKWYYV